MSPSITSALALENQLALLLNTDAPGGKSAGSLWSAYASGHSVEPAEALRDIILLTNTVIEQAKPLVNISVEEQSLANIIQFEKFLVQMGWSVQVSQFKERIKNTAIRPSLGHIHMVLEKNTNQLGVVSGQKCDESIAQIDELLDMIRSASDIDEYSKSVLLKCFSRLRGALHDYKIYGYGSILESLLELQGFIQSILMRCRGEEEEKAGSFETITTVARWGWTCFAAYTFNQTISQKLLGMAKDLDVTKYLN